MKGTNCVELPGWHHDWVMANDRTEAALKAKRYHYRYLFCQSAGHGDGKVQDATLADSLVWDWRGYLGETR